MWNEWKKKIARLFFKEIEEEEEIERSPRDINSMHDQDVHTRIMHKYPNRTSFRFPVIPDQPHREETEKSALDQNYLDIEQPAYVRKKYNRNRSAEQSETHKTEQPKSERKKDYGGYHQPEQYRQTREQSTNEQQESKNKHKPFTPTHVPSPIYGFHKREQEKDPVEVPAYIRKQQKEDETEHNEEQEIEMSSPSPSQQKVEISLGSAEEVETETEFQGTETHIEVKDDQEQEESPSETESADTMLYGQMDEQEEQNKASREIEQTAEAAATVEPVKKENPTHTTRSRKPRKERESKQTQPNKEQQNQTIPFNVMMSANDKRALRERKNLSRDRAAPPVKKSIPYRLLNDPVQQDSQDQLWVANQQELLEKTLKHFRVKASVVRATQGPTVTRFEVQPEMGVKVSKIKNLSDDLKLNMAAKDIRIEAPIPGKNTVGIEIPNLESQMVGLQEIFTTDAFQNNPSPLTVALGLTVEGSPQVTTIDNMPHGLIAGATGSGKSVCINTILVSLIYKASHQDVKFMLIDPKMVELAPFNHIPHLISPVITDIKAATQALKWAVNEMEDRYEKFVKEGVRDIKRYNEKMLKQNRPADKMSYLVIVIDELADLMMLSPQDVEDAICRIAQKARACGMHLLVATQRPSVDVITGLIKANIPTRIAFSVSSQVDSRTIMDTNGAEKLLGKGDMLFIENGAGKSVRLQGAFVSDEEIERVTKYARSIATPEYAFEQDDLLEQIAVDQDDEDELLEECIAFVVEQNSASTSLLQRHFKIGYNRAARLMDSMEMKGIIAQQNGSKPREVLISESQLSRQD